MILARNELRVSESQWSWQKGTLNLFGGDKLGICFFGFYYCGWRNGGSGWCDRSLFGLSVWVSLNDLQWLSCEFKVILLELNLMIPQCNTWSEFRLSSKRSERSKKQRWPQELRPWAWNQQKIDFTENAELMQSSWNLTEVLQPLKNPHMGRFSYSNIHMICWKSRPPATPWNQSDQPPWIYFQQSADQILRVRAGRRLGIVAEESEVALLDGLVAWGLEGIGGKGLEVWERAIRGCMSIVLLYLIILRRYVWMKNPSQGNPGQLLFLNRQRSVWLYPSSKFWKIWTIWCKKQCYILFRTDLYHNVGYVYHTGMYYLPSTYPNEYHHIIYDWKIISS